MKYAGKFEVNTSKFVTAHRKQPRGTGMWFFGDRDETKTVFFSGSYSDCKKKALKWAEENLNETSTIYVMP